MFKETNSTFFCEEELVESYESCKEQKNQELMGPGYMPRSIARTSWLVSMVFRFRSLLITFSYL